MGKYRNCDEYRGFDHGLSYMTGVSDLNPWALRYMMRPHSHTSRTFWSFYNETVEMIKEYMHTKATLVPVVGPGRVAMDAAVNNFLEPGDAMVMIDNGFWGRYPEVMAQTYGIEVVPLVFPSNRPVAPGVVEKRLQETTKDIRVVHMMHVETESGIINPIRKIGEIVHRVLPDSLFIVDSATAFPGNKLLVDEWGIDVDYFVSHKGFNGPSGLTFLSVNERAMAAVQRRKTLARGWYTSIKNWKESWLEYENDGRHCLESFPNLTLLAMRAKLDLMNQMGEEKYLKKYRLASKAIRMGLRKMTEPDELLLVPGPRCEGCPGCDATDPNENPDGVGRFCAQTDVTIAYPKGTDWKKVMETLEERYWITCPHFGFGDIRMDGYFYSGNGMRVGMVNDRQHYPHNILALITGLGFSLKEAGVQQIRWEKGVEAANRVLEEMQRELGWDYYEKSSG
jgi:alanine-glyoxylate transaminase/serine-glyoxylate transaminase/serine-pyruvate transaminase